MVEFGRIWLRLAVIFAAGGAASEFALRPVLAQQTRVELSSNVELDEADALTRGHLERVKRLFADRQWDETIETLRQVSDQRGDKVIAVAPTYYVRIRDFCHRRFAAMPTEALAIYRGQVDGQAKQWFDDGSERHDEAVLRKIVDQFYCSSYGDEALWLLGEMALERGDYGAARSYWEQLIEMPPASIDDAAFEGLLKDPSLTKDEAKLIESYYRRHEKLPLYELYSRDVVDPNLMRAAVLLRVRGIVGPRLAYPSAEYPASDVYARLILTSILEGSFAWAEAGLRDLAEVYPEAKGRLAGREMNFVAGLTELLSESRSWPRQDRSTDWLTFGGNPARNRMAVEAVDIGYVKWRRPLTPIIVAAGDEPIRRIAEDRRAALSYHPIVVGDKVFVSTPWQILGFDLKTGGPAWGSDFAIYRPDDMNVPAESSFGGNPSSVGTPRFTLTAHRNRLYAKMGSSITSAFSADGQIRLAPNFLICLDIAQEGKRIWKINPPEDRWSFEGAPVVDDGCVYVAMRKAGVRPQAHVACYDADTQALLWRRMISSADTPAQGTRDEITHNLLTLVGDTIYYNTNLGAVAALSKHDGEVRWVTLYPRAVGTDPNQSLAHLDRDLTPCVYDRGALYVAPADSRHILAIDATSGLLHWQTADAEDVVHLIGTGGDFLFAGGDRMSCIDTRTAKVALQWPQDSPKGYGRGALAHEQLIWPTRDALEIFSPNEPAPREILLKNRDPNAKKQTPPRDDLLSGNIIPAGEYLLVAGADELIAFSRHGSVRSESADVYVPETKLNAPDDRSPTTIKRAIE